MADWPDPATWVDLHGDYLYRYAFCRLGKADVAEDLVQETLLAALKGRHAFAGQSSERTWLVGILKNKVVDHLRRQGRQATTLPATEEVLDRLFDDKGRWRPEARSRCTDDPASALERKELWETMQRCLSKLPGRLATAFCLREMDGMASAEIQEVLGVSAGNLWALLHRARLGLCRCLEVHWFGAAGEE